MKRLICLLLAAALCLTVCGCAQSSSQKAFDRSKEAFSKVNEAYSRVNDYSKDIYEAWRLGINDKSKYDGDDELGDLAAELSIGQEYIEQAIARLLKKDSFAYGDWSYLQFFYSSFFSACVDVVSTAYVCSGDVEEITVLLQDAKTLMKELSSDYSDYEHYPSLKAYFTNTLAFFDFCQHPEGSFDQVVETFNNYRNNAREYFFDLNYVFEDSIGGMNETATVPAGSENDK